ncbi:MAG: short-chain dehydrogenase [Betaproteobacteria bacterium RIFCSPLOWO2_12_FULL_62_13b]|nr:MAG: short-chain dehydrogenase [Betaproteobacteria bacterium RIFCSPLOWO2_12_FULL_62_13b]
MSDRLKGKVAIVTGGAAGIGEATAVLFAEEGAKVVIADVDEAAGMETVARIRAQGGEAIFVSTDISREGDARKACDEAVRAFGRLHILVNNAANFMLKGLEASIDDWHRSLGVNVIGTALISRYAAEAIKNAGGGAIVNLGSISSFIAQPSFVAYSATKAALVQMTRNMAMDLAPFNIRVNCVCPGTILTQAVHRHVERVGVTLEEFLTEERPKYLLSRIGEPREVAYAILFLASNEASFITGAHLMVDGGYTAR